MLKKRVFWLKLVVALLLPALLSSCSGQDGMSRERQTAMRDDLLGTIISISLYSDNAEYLFEQSFNAIEEIDMRMSANRPDSEISLLNQSEHGHMTVSEDIFDLLNRSDELSALSGGAFDVTIGAVTTLWRIDGDFSVLPSDEKIRESLSFVGYRGILLSEADRTVSVPDGMMIDLGSIAKGHALDVVAELLMENGVRHALLDFGGDIRLIGHRPDGHKWRIGILSPIIGDTDLACIIEVSDVSVLTSGGYERFFEQDGIRYHHILSPQTGYPADSGLLSVTVIGHSSTDADALSTAGFVLGLREGMALLESLDGFEGIFITNENVIHTTSGLRGKLTIASEAFTLASE